MSKKKPDTRNWKCRSCKELGLFEITGQIGNVYYAICKNETVAGKKCNTANVFNK